MKKNCLCWILTVNLLLIACSASKQISHLAKSDLLNNKALISAHAGISIYEPATQRYWYNFQGDKYFIPASNTKLPTCYAAMKYLGDSLTGILYHATNDTLFISATGDPTFLHPDFRNQRVYELFNTTKKPLVLNTSLWDEKRWGPGWGWDDYNDYYMAERSPMPIYGNVATFSHKLKNIQASPSYFSNKIVWDSSSNREALIWREIASNKFFIRKEDTLPGVTEIPFYTETDSTILNLLKDTLHKAVYWSNEKSRGLENELHSQPLDSLLKPMMHRSDNFFAEQTLLMLSAKLLHTMNSKKIIDTLLKSDFNDLPQQINWVDGSGMSRYNLFTPQDFIAILNKMKNEFGMERIKHILPTGGSGTLSNYYKAESGYIFAKTGTLSGVVALSGFLYTRKNKLLIFSVLVNNHAGSAADIRKAIEKFIKELRARK